MNTWMLEVSEEDSFTLVFKHVAEILDTDHSVEEGQEMPGSQFLSAFDTFVKKDPETEEMQLPEEAIPTLLELFIKQIPVLFDKATDADAESCVQLINHHLYTKLPPAQTSGFATSMADALASNYTVKPETRLSCLTHMYNASAAAKDQYTVLMKAIDFAVKANLAHILGPVVLGNAEALVSNWELSSVESSKLYLSIAALVRKGREKDAHGQSIALTSNALAFIDAADTTACKQVAEEAADAVADFLKAKDLFASDLSELAPVKALGRHPAHRYLYHLFNVIAKGSIDQLNAVCKEDLLQTLGITREQCLDKTRMAALLNLARDSINEPIAYDVISSALDIDVGDVEQWIVKASGAKLVTARIDQFQRTVSVLKCASKGFDGNEWTRIRNQFQAWKEILVDMEKLMTDNNAVENLNPAVRT